MATANAALAAHSAQSLTTPSLDERSIALRRMVVRTLAGGERGHVGSSMSLIEIMRVLYDDVLRYRPQEPKWRGRDRVILSKGHGCIAQYVMLADKGFIPLETLDTFCRRDSILGGHPEAGEDSGRRSLHRRARPRPLGRRRHGARRPHRETRQPRVRGDGRRRDQRRLGVGGGALRRQAQAFQPHRRHRLQQDPVGRPDPRNPGPRAAARQVEGVQFRRRRCRRP